MIGAMRAGTTLAFMYAAALIAAPSWAQQPRYSSGWNDPAAPSPTAPRANEPLDELVKELDRLVSEAAKARAADPRFLADLRDLVRRYAWPWRRRLVFDDFSDGDTTRNPAWQTAGAAFQVSSYGGLRSRYAGDPVQQSAGSRDEPQDLRSALLGTLLEQMARKDQAASAPPPSQGPAQMALAVPVPNSFAVELNFASATRESGRFEVGVTQGGQLLGYRVAYNPGTSRPLELLRIGSHGSAVIESVQQRLSLEDGKLHTLQMTRDAAGEMTVRIDGKEVIRTVDRAFRSDFDGIVMVNRGGDYTIRSVAVYGG